MIFDNFEETQWVRENDVYRLKIDEEVQVSPSENYLSREFQGWCFYESQRLMPGALENCLVRLAYQRRCCACEVAGDSENSRKSFSSHRGIGLATQPKVSLKLEGDDEIITLPDLPEVTFGEDSSSNSQVEGGGAGIYFDCPKELYDDAADKLPEYEPLQCKVGVQARINWREIEVTTKQASF